MGQLDHMQLLSNCMKPTQLFSSFQTLGNTTILQPFATTLGIPLAIAGDGTHNPVGVIDNRHTRATSYVFIFGLTTANNSKLAIDIIGFSGINKPGVGGSPSLYLPTRFFLGEAQAGNYDISAQIGETTAFLADNFDLKTFAGFNSSYIEPSDDSSAAMLIVDVRGADYITVRLAQGAVTAATKGQCWYGVN